MFETCKFFQFWNILCMKVTYLNLNYVKKEFKYSISKTNVLWNINQSDKQTDNRRRKHACFQTGIKTKIILIYFFRIGFFRFLKCVLLSWPDQTTVILEKPSLIKRHIDKTLSHKTLHSKNATVIKLYTRKTLQI